MLAVSILWVRETKVQVEKHRPVTSYTGTMHFTWDLGSTGRTHVIADDLHARLDREHPLSNSLTKSRTELMSHVTLELTGKHPNTSATIHSLSSYMKWMYLTQVWSTGELDHNSFTILSWRPPKFQRSNPEHIHVRLLHLCFCQKQTTEQTDPGEHTVT